MTTAYQDYRSRHLVVPGGTVRPLQPAPVTYDCPCYPTGLTSDMVEETVFVDGIEWAIYQRCPIHGDCYKAPVSGCGLNDETDVVQTSVEKGA